MTSLGARAEAPRGIRLPRLLRHRAFLAYVVVAGLWIVASAVTRGFGAPGHLVYMLELAAVIGIVAAGQTLVVVGGGIDLSVGTVITVTAISLPFFTFSFDTTGLVGVALTLAMAAAIGAVNGLGVGLLRVHPMIMTLAMGTLLQGALLWNSGNTAVSVDNPAVEWLGRARPWGVPADTILWVVLSAAVLTLLHRTPLGAKIYAIGTNPLVARLSGVDETRVTILLYTLCGLLAGLAGLVQLGANGQGYIGIGDPFLLSSIAAVVLGGTSILGGRGTYAGTIPGAVLLVTLSSLITVTNVSPGWRNILFGSLVLVLLLLSGREARR